MIPILGVTMAALTVVAHEAAPPSELTLSSATRAEAIIRRAVSAHGLEKALAGDGAIHLKFEGTENDPDQARRPFAPPEREAFGVEGLIDLRSRRLSFEVSTNYPGGFAFRWRRVLTPESAALVSELVRETYPLGSEAGVRIWDRAEPYFLPILIDRLSRAAQDARWMGEMVRQGRTYDALTVPRPPGGQATVLFARDSGLIGGYETLEADSLRGTWVSTVAYEYPPRTAEGEPLIPKALVRRRGDEVLETLDLAKADFAAAAPPEAFLPPPDYPKSVFGKPDLRRVADGVYTVTALGGGFYNALFVVQPEGIVAVDVPLGAAVAELALKQLAAVAPGKPVTHAVFTHYHLDHTGGAEVFIRRGARLVTTEGNKAVFEAIAKSAGLPPPTLQFVEDRLTIGSGATAVDVRRLGRTPHVDEMLLIWLPHTSVAFNGDLFSRLVPPNETAAFFLAELGRLGLAPKTVIGSHHAPTTVGEIDGALRRARLEPIAPRSPRP